MFTASLAVAACHSPAGPSLRDQVGAFCGDLAARLDGAAQGGDALDDRTGRALEIMSELHFCASVHVARAEWQRTTEDRIEQAAAAFRAAGAADTAARAIHDLVTIATDINSYPLRE